MSASRGTKGRGGLDVVRDIVDYIIVYSNRAAGLRHILNFLQGISQKPYTRAESHLDYAEAPIRAGIIGKDAEIMVLSVGIQDVLEVQGDERADRTADAITQSANLQNMQVVSIILRETLKDKPEQGRYRPTIYRRKARWTW